MYFHLKIYQSNFLKKKIFLTSSYQNNPKTPKKNYFEAKKNSKFLKTPVKTKGQTPPKTQSPNKITCIKRLLKLHTNHS
jgi:hypothetical protein